LRICCSLRLVANDTRRRSPDRSLQSVGIPALRNVLIFRGELRANFPCKTRDVVARINPRPRRTAIDTVSFLTKAELLECGSNLRNLVRKYAIDSEDCYIDRSHRSLSLSARVRASLPSSPLPSFSPNPSALALVSLLLLISLPLFSRRATLLLFRRGNIYAVSRNRDWRFRDCVSPPRVDSSIDSSHRGASASTIAIGRRRTMGKEMSTLPVYVFLRRM